jgi:hypothetical protein
LTLEKVVNLIWWYSFNEIIYFLPLFNMKFSKYLLLSILIHLVIIILLSLWISYYYDWIDFLLAMIFLLWWLYILLLSGIDFLINYSEIPLYIFAISLNFLLVYVISKITYNPKINNMWYFITWVFTMISSTIWLYILIMMIQ